jgi:hypothetical protein
LVATLAWAQKTDVAEVELKQMLKRTKSVKKKQT